ncbi:LysR substrate-binding domain-containing protein [Saccharopolyspora gloriosae]|uniref:LysR substrate-binding domain-containing protein n=1 Tax=Saccharopolyspora gloriosae TaxID=455344 RepID=UPI001FB5EF31|nr:LysR substrate-binding domain-containing protein [Saccharopolyspora gloriosae]
MGLDLRKLEHLVAVAEEGGFTRAATRLHLSQQALSTSVRSLEREVGVPLLRRDAAGVTPLPAGQALIDDARILNGIARSALHRARRIGRGGSETLRIGHTPAVTSDEVTALVHTALAELPGLHTDVHQHYPPRLTDDLLSGEIDLGLCRGIRPEHGLTRSTLTQDRLAVAVAVDHHLAGREHVQLTELARERLVVWGDPGRSGYTDLLLDHCRQAGFEPDYLRNPIQGTPPVTAVIGTDCVALVTAPPGPAAGGRTQVVELRPTLLAPLHALWPAHINHATRDAFLRATGG